MRSRPAAHFALGQGLPGRFPARKSAPRGPKSQYNGRERVDRVDRGWMMKLTNMICVFVLLTASAMAVSAQQSLADQARAATRNKPAEHAKVVFDNDNLPRGGGVSVVG